MLVIHCRLTMADGQQVTGKIEARSSGLSYKIAYAGAIDRLERMPDEGTPSDLELLFRLAAQQTGATLAIEKTGSYESRTEFLQRTRN